MTATIVLQNHSFLSLVFSFIGVISIIMTALYAAFARTSVDRTIGLIFCLVITCYIVLEHIKRYLFLKKGYVSVIQISDDKMRLVYSYFSERKAKNINFSDIKSFKVIIKAGMISRLFTRGGSTSARVYNIKIIIDTGKECIELPVHPNQTDPGSNLDFMYPLIDVCDKIPNFSYEIEGDAFLKETFREYAASKLSN